MKGCASDLLTALGFFLAAALLFSFMRAEPFRGGGGGGGGGGGMGRGGGGGGLWTWTSSSNHTTYSHWSWENALRTRWISAIHCGL